MSLHQQPCRLPLPISVIPISLRVLYHRLEWVLPLAFPGASPRFLLNWVELASAHNGLTDSMIAIQSAKVAAEEAADCWSLPSRLQVTLARRSAPGGGVKEVLTWWLVSKTQIFFVELFILKST